MQVGYSGALGLGLTSLLKNRVLGLMQNRVSHDSQSGKKMILVWTTGAMSHHDTLDMKPDAPRGSTWPVQPNSNKNSRLPGV